MTFFTSLSVHEILLQYSQSCIDCFLRAFCLTTDIAAGDLLVSIDPEGDAPNDDSDNGSKSTPESDTTDDSALDESAGNEDNRAANGASREKEGDAADDVETNPILAS